MKILKPELTEGELSVNLLTRVLPLTDYCVVDDISGVMLLSHEKKNTFFDKEPTADWQVPNLSRRS